jgi:hypothetical protein
VAWQETAVEHTLSALIHSIQVQNIGAIAQLGERLHGMYPLGFRLICLHILRFFESIRSVFVFAKRSPRDAKKMI